MCARDRTDARSEAKGRRDSPTRRQEGRALKKLAVDSWQFAVKKDEEVISWQFAVCSL